ncbi:hypothetical protein BH18PSE1_BH18PSE1_05350 [soil metagenome]
MNRLLAYTHRNSSIWASTASPIKRSRCTLYKGYVKQTNRLNERISELFARRSGRPRAAAYSELTRRLGFEYNGTVLHEYYFGNLKKSGFDHPDHNAAFYQAAEASFGRYDLWRTDFIAVGQMRGGVGRSVTRTR